MQLNGHSLKPQVKPDVGAQSSSGAPHATVIIDGQFGSTGKGLVASWLYYAGHVYDLNTTNAGPNSGHTSYDSRNTKVTLKQLPTYAVIRYRNEDKRTPIYLNGGSVIDRSLLNEEIRTWLDPDLFPSNQVLVHSTAAEIKTEHKEADSRTVSAISSTGQGVGPALSEKVARLSGAVMVRARVGDQFSVDRCHGGPISHGMRNILIEVAQGFSLGINQGFYPYCTARECSVAQALADADIPPQTNLIVIGVFRTYPIRVGSVPGATSGGVYPDQRELSWDDIGVDPELTTVTKRKRRVFTWSDDQFAHFVCQNQPNVLFFNFMNYLPRDQWESWVRNRLELYVRIVGKSPTCVLLGTGPLATDVRYFP